MLVRHSLTYLAGRILPGATSVLTVVLYTRLLSADEYGRYSLIIASVGIANAVLFQWLSLSVGRFLHGRASGEVLSLALGGYLSLVLATGAVAVAALGFVHGSQARLTVVLVVVTAWAQAWFDLNLRITNARLAALRYGAVSSVRAVLALSAAAGLAYMGWGVIGVVLGSAGASVLASLFLYRHWTRVSIRSFSIGMLGPFVAYGAPLAVTFIMSMVLDLSDRFLLGWMASTREVAVYAAAYDLAQHSLGGFLAVIYLAAYPLAIKALETQGERAALDQVRQNQLVLLAVALPATVGLALLSGNVSYTLIGPSVREGADALIPVVAAAVMIWGIKCYYIDLAFHLTRQMRLQLWPVAVAALINVALNMWLIPTFQLMGAAYATLAACIAGTCMAWILGKRVYPLPSWHPELPKVIAATLGAGAVIWSTREWRGALALALQVTAGAAAYLLLAVVLNVGGARFKLKLWTRRCIKSQVEVDAPATSRANRRRRLE